METGKWVEDVHQVEKRRPDEHNGWINELRYEIKIVVVVVIVIVHMYFYVYVSKG